MTKFPHGQYLVSLMIPELFQDSMAPILPFECRTQRSISAARYQSTVWPGVNFHTSHPVSRTSSASFSGVPVKPGKVP